MKCLNEENYVDRCVGDFHDETFVDSIIVIDGGSGDYTVQRLKEFSKVEVFVHPWLDWYHQMENCQQNIGLSYIPEGSLVMMMDFDERMSPELKEYLTKVDASEITIPENCAVNFSRRTFSLVRYPDSPFCMYGDDGWPEKLSPKENYPDFQNRLLRKSYKMRFVNSPHRVMIGQDHELFVENCDITHYEKDDFRDRTRIEKKWLRNQARRKELGLTADIFECKPKMEIAKYADPEGWK
jgi:glycosyltransferase involved in cell wall biosynthesis